MNAKFPGFPAMNTPIVYIRAVRVADLPDDIQDQADGAEMIYSVHRPDGERLALVKDRQTAFFLARENDLSPVNVH
jgi:hypothetical protein